MSNTQVNQDIRFSNRGDDNNPESLFDFVKPTRIVVNAIGGAQPLSNTAENLWWLIDSDTGNFWYKNRGIWTLLYTFGSGGVGNITGASSVGIGEDIYARQNGSLLEFKTLVSQPSAVQSSVILGEVGLNEVNITAPSTVSDVINYGVSSDGWIIDSASTTVDSNGNVQLFAKNLVAGNGILIQTQTVGSDKSILISNTSQPDSPQYHYQFQTAQSYNVLSTFQNLPPFSSTLNSSDWVFNQNINGSSFVQYIGDPDVVYSFNYDISASATLQPLSPFNFIFRVAEGNPIISQVGIPLSGTVLHFSAQTPNNTTSFNTTSTTFLFKPTVGQYYTLQASCTINNLVLSVEEIKLNITKV